MTDPAILLELDATTLRPQDASEACLAAVRADDGLAAWWNRRATVDHLLAFTTMSGIHVPELTPPDEQPHET